MRIWQATFNFESPMDIVSAGELGHGLEPILT